MDDCTTVTYSTIFFLETKRDYLEEVSKEVQGRKRMPCANMIDSLEP